MFAMLGRLMFHDQTFSAAQLLKLIFMIFSTVFFLPQYDDQRRVILRGVLVRLEILCMLTFEHINVYERYSHVTTSRSYVVLISTGCNLVLYFSFLHVESTREIVYRMQLDLTHNHVGPDGALSLAFCLSRNTTLRRLILRHNFVGDAGCEALARAVASSNLSLTELSLAANGLTGAAARALGAMLAANTTLCGLDVSANDLGQVDLPSGVTSAKGEPPSPLFGKIDNNIT